MNPADTLDLLHERMKTCGWHIAATLGLGLLAAPLAVYGEHCLAEAAPIFPLIQQNYGLWQSAYVGALIVIGLLWAAAMLQKIHAFQDNLAHIRTQQRILEQRAMRERAAQAPKQEREIIAPVLSPSMRNARSNKFDY